MWMTRWLLVALCLLLLILPPHSASAKDAIDLEAAVPLDPELSTVGTLPNGMRYWIRPHKRPEGSVSAVLHVDAGSVHEERLQQGLAHFVEHMAFEGSKNFPPGTMAPYFASQGVTFGRHQNATTSFGSTEYRVHLPVYSDEAFQKTLLFLSDAARDITFPKDEVEKEKAIILEEFRYWGDLSGRIWSRRVPLLLKGSRYAFRQPLGNEIIVKKATPLALRTYHQTWYRPERSTVIVVGDIDPKKAEGMIRKTFGDWAKATTPVPKLKMGRLAARGIRVGVFPDPDEHYTQVTITHTRKRRPIKTYGDMRRALVDMLAERMMRARFEYLRATKSALYAQAWMRASTLVPGLDMIECGSTGQSGRWIGCLREVVHEVTRVQRFGFEASELERMREQILAAYDTPTRSTSASLAEGYQRALRQGRRPIAGAHWEKLTRHCLPGITVQEVSQAFRALYDLDHVSIILSVSEPEEGQEPPSEAEVLEYYKEARTDKLKTWTERNARLKVASILDKDPEPGTVAKTERIESLGVTSWLLENGVRVQTRKLDKPGRVWVRTSLHGGQLEETEENVGITELAFGSIRYDGIAAKGLHPDTAARYMATRQISLSCWHDPGIVGYSLRATKKDLDDGMRLLWLMLSKPVVHYNALKDGREYFYGRNWNTRRDPERMADHLLEYRFSGKDPRWSLANWTQISELPEKDIQAWMERIVLEAPMEVAIVGDIEPKEAKALATRWFGSLPKRDTARQDALTEKRTVKTWKGPIRVREDVESHDPAASVRVAWRGVGPLDDADRAAMDHAAHIIDARLFDDLRGEHGLAYGVSARYADDRIEHMGYLVVELKCDPKRAKEAASIARRVVMDFAKKGPTKDELASVGRQWRSLMKEGDEEASTWLGRLGALHLDGRPLSDATKLASVGATVDAARLKKVLKRVVKDERMCEIVTIPVEPKEDD